MAEMKLVLRFRRQGETEAEVKTAARIRLDGKGSLRVIDPQTGAAEALSLSGIEEMSIYSVPGSGWGALVA